MTGVEIGVVIFVIALLGSGAKFSSDPSKPGGPSGPGGSKPKSPKFGGGKTPAVKGVVACQLGLRGSANAIATLRAGAFGGAEIPLEIDGVKVSVQNLGAQVPAAAWSLWRFARDAEVTWPEPFSDAPEGGELVAGDRGPHSIVDAVHGAVRACAATGQWGNCPAPAGWDPAANGLWISPNCDCVLEGALFEPASRGQKTISAIEEPTLTEVLAAAPDNSVFGFVDYLMDVEGFQTPEEIVERILVDANALCADIPHDQRPDPLRLWFHSLVDRIRPWVEISTIGFDVGDA